jgi:hypothetical protein|eukprot:TRINITY_DN13076_c0_g1_i1.p1 TRINITY_DN13076_c0_g1~~TRINITY_DN13076_c0_g1_i1.p1  ORF type:complete len:252 (-),score=28.22 TRINITY_DN13076_c0_g1_i1:285-1040(-)
MEEDEGPKLNKASIDDEFLRHPHSGAYVRNPLIDKSRSVPILFQAGEFEHNCLGEALSEYQVISVSESNFRAMISPTAADTTLKPETTGNPTLLSGSSTLAGSLSSSGMRNTLTRAALGRLRDLPGSYEFVITLRKSTYVPPRVNRRRPVEPRTATGVLVDKANIEINDVNGKFLRIETVNEGLISVWNRLNPAFQVRQSDLIVKVNTVSKNAPGMLEEIAAAPDLVKMTIRRSPQDPRRASHTSVVDVAA